MENKTKIQKQTKSHEKFFDKYLIESIDEALSTLGEPVKNSLYCHLKHNFNIEKDEITNRIQDFSEIIHRTFGFGASRLETMFIKNLNSKLNIDIKWNEPEWPFTKWILNDMTFTQYIYSIKQNFSPETQENISFAINEEIIKSPIVLEVSL